VTVKTQGRKKGRKAMEGGSRGTDRGGGAHALSRDYSIQMGWAPNPRKKRRSAKERGEGCTRGLQRGTIFWQTQGGFLVGGLAPPEGGAEVTTKENNTGSFFPEFSPGNKKII